MTCRDALNDQYLNTKHGWIRLWNERGTPFSTVGQLRCVVELQLVRTMNEPTILPVELQSTADRFIGKKVLIVGDHPWADRVGIVNGLVRTAAGWGFEVTFTDKTLANGGCFVFDKNHWKVIE